LKYDVSVYLIYNSSIIYEPLQKITDIFFYEEANEMARRMK